MSDRTPLARLYDTARRQHQAFAISQAVELGVGRPVIERMAQRGETPRLHRGVYAGPGSDDTFHRRASAALLAVRGEAFLAGRTAASLWGFLDGTPPVVELLRRSGRAGRSHRRVVVHRTTRLPPPDISRRHRLPLTAPARTVVDLAAVLDPERLLQVATVAQEQRLLSTRALVDAIERMGTAAGRGDLQRLVPELRRTERTDSGLERDVRRTLIAAGYAPYIGTYPLRVAGRLLRLDIAYPKYRIVVECDSRRWHRLPEAFEHDRERWNLITRAGWRILFVTALSFEADPTAIVRELAVAMKQR